MRMMKFYANFCLILLCTLGLQAQSPAIKWQKAVVTNVPYVTEYGDLITVNEILNCMVPTTDGGYMGLLTSSLGATTSKLVKFSATGDTVFTKKIGLVNNVGGFAIFDMVAATDGGFVVVGSSIVTGAGSGVANEEKLSLRKYSDNGLLVWEENFTGGYFNDQTTKRLSAASLVRSKDGGYVIAAGSNNLAGNDKTENTKGELDYWVIKTDVNGLIEWDVTLGGSRSDYPADIIALQDGGYVIAGYSNSPASGDKSGDQKGGADAGLYNNDFWVVKINADGVRQWDKTIGSSKADYARLMVATPDGGFVLAGDTEAGIDGDKTEANFTTDEWDSETTDTWVLKLDKDGNIQWQKCLGGRKTDVPASAYVQGDGSIILNITSNSPASANKSIAAFGKMEYDAPSGIYYFWEDRDYWVVKMSPAGTVTWQTVLGGLSMDVAGPILPSQDGGIMVTGRSNSVPGAIGNRNVENKAYDDAIFASGGDIWMAVLDETSLPVNLLSFTGQARNGQALLQWKTATEENFSHFELEKSNNGLVFGKIASLPAKGTGSNYTHPDALVYGTNYYRLKMIDKDGSFSYSKIVSFGYSNIGSASIAPNPVVTNQVLKLSMTAAPKNASWQILGVDGKLFATQKIPAGSTQVSIDTRALAKGVYSLVYSNGTDSKLLRFMKQ